MDWETYIQKYQTENLTTGWLPPDFRDLQLANAFMHLDEQELRSIIAFATKYNMEFERKRKGDYFTIKLPLFPEEFSHEFNALKFSIPLLETNIERINDHLVYHIYLMRDPFAINPYTSNALTRLLTGNWQGIVSETQWTFILEHNLLEPPVIGMNTKRAR